jgi:outer membrane lipoprotein-sorting protein
MLSLIVSFFMVCKASPHKDLHKKVTQYLHGINAIVGSFIQTNPDETKVEGYFWLKRPKEKTGKIRIDYVNGQRIYGDDKTVVIYDLVNNTKTDPIPSEDTPATFLFAKRIDLSQFSPYYKMKNDQISVLLKTKNADMTLFFELYPKTSNIKTLKGWHILDIQGNVTVVKFNPSTLHINDLTLVKDSLFNK